MTVDELRAHLVDLPADLPVAFRQDYHLNVPVSGLVVLEDGIVLTPYTT